MKRGNQPSGSLPYSLQREVINKLTGNVGFSCSPADCLMAEAESESSNCMRLHNNVYDVRRGNLPSGSLPYSFQNEARDELTGKVGFSCSPADCLMAEAERVSSNSTSRMAAR